CCRSTTTTSCPACFNHHAVETPMIPLPNTAIFIYLPHCVPAGAPDKYANSSGSDCVCRVCEGVGVKLVFRKAANFGKIFPGTFHHDGSATGIDLVVGKIGNVFHDSLMHEAGATLPIVLRLSLGYNRHVLEVWQLAFPFAGQRVRVEIMGTTPSPVGAYRARVARRNHGFRDGLDDRNPRTADKKLGRQAALAEEERAQWCFHAQKHA